MIIKDKRILTITNPEKRLPKANNSILFSEKMGLNKGFQNKNVCNTGGIKNATVKVENRYEKQVRPNGTVVEKRVHIKTVVPKK